MQSQYIYNDGITKSRLLRQTDNWFRVECKRADTDEPWRGGLVGTAEWLALTREEIDMAYPDKSHMIQKTRRDCS